MPGNCFAGVGRSGSQALLPLPAEADLRRRNRHVFSAASVFSAGCLCTRSAKRPGCPAPPRSPGWCGAGELPRYEHLSGVFQNWRPVASGGREPDGLCGRVGAEPYRGPGVPPATAGGSGGGGPDGGRPGRDSGPPGRVPGTPGHGRDFCLPAGQVPGDRLFPGL